MADFMAALETELRVDEGYRLKLYKDSVGKWTIGIGHNIDDLGLSPAIVTAIFAEDVAAVEAMLDKYFAWWRQLDEVRQRVVINLAFNLGPQLGQEETHPGLLKWTTTMGKIQAHDFAGAADAMLANGRWVSQVGPRAQRLADRMRKGIP